MGEYKNLGLVYQGSKRSIADKIYHAMTAVIGEADGRRRFVDVFCGGGAMGFCASQHGENVLMNDANSYLIFLLDFFVHFDKQKEELKQYYFENIYSHFFSREEYKELKNTAENQFIEDKIKLKTGFAFACFSFGGKFGTTYIYGKDREQLKKLVHNFIFFGNGGELEKIADVDLLNDFPFSDKRENYKFLRNRRTRYYLP